MAHEKEMIRILKQVKNRIDPSRTNYICCFIWSTNGLKHAKDKLYGWINSALGSFDSYGEWLRGNHPALYCGAAQTEGRQQWIDSMIAELEEDIKSQRRINGGI